MYTLQDLARDNTRALKESKTRRTRYQVAELNSVLAHIQRIIPLRSIALVTALPLTSLTIMA